MGDTTNIWFQKYTVEGRLPLLDRMYRNHVERVTRPETSVRFVSLPAETYDSEIPASLVRYGGAEVMFSWFFTAQARRAEQQGFDAYIIGTSQDPGLREARTLASIPVLGYGETSFFTCAAAGLRFGVVGFIPELEEPIRENLHTYGLTSWLAGFSYIDGSAAVTAALSGEPSAFLDAFEQAAAKVIQQGAQIIVPGEGLPNEILVDSNVRSIDGVPVLDSDGLVLKAAEHAADLRRTKILPQPTVGYRHRALPKDEELRLFQIFHPRAVEE